MKRDSVKNSDLFYDNIKRKIDKTKKEIDKITGVIKWKL